MEENKTNEQVELTPVSELAPVLNVLKEHDAQLIRELREELTDTWSKRQIFRTETEMRVSVLNDVKHPTPASKYWQAVREQSAMFENLVSLSFELRRNEIKRKKLEKKLSETQDELDAAEISIDLDQNIYERASMEQTAKDRVREIGTWSEIKKELDNGQFDNKNVNTHQVEALHLTLLNRAQTLNEHSDPTEVQNIMGPLQTMHRLKEQNLLAEGGDGKTIKKLSFNPNGHLTPELQAAQPEQNQQ
jgi:hypothetical protein